VDQPGSLNYRLFFTNAETGHVISPFHDIPLWVPNTDLANMVVEIPKGTSAKMEISTKEPLNPIKQDVKNGALRYVHWPYPCNYGAFPQTWENPEVVDENTGARGDRDPVDVCEISGLPVHSGAVIQVKILGCYAMIDEGETDWKVIAINTADPDADLMNDISDVDPKKLQEIFAFLKYYKTPTGAPPNVFGFEEKVQNRDTTVKIILDTHEEWRRLVTGEYIHFAPSYALIYTDLDVPSYELSSTTDLDVPSNSFPKK